MINIIIKEQCGHVLSIQAKGHSGYAEVGQDIVCSAVSTVMNMSLMGLKEVLDTDVDYSIDEKIPFMRLTLSKYSHDTDIVMNMAKISLIALKDSYKKYIKITIE